MSTIYKIPPQRISSSKKNLKWRKQHLDWAASHSYSNYSPVRNTIRNKMINYDLFAGKIHMDDLYNTLDPERLGFNKEEVIEHYPVINNKLKVLIGEELSRSFDYSVTITNPNSISQIEEEKKKVIFNWLEQFIQKSAQQQQVQNPTPQQQQQQGFTPQQEQEISDFEKYINYTWKDIREIRANCILNHYSKEQNFDLIFNKGFEKALIVGEEIYHCDIISGEPVLEVVNDLKLSVYMSGYSNKIEDADVLIYEDYWSPAKIYDVYYEDLTEEDRKKLDKMENFYDTSDEMMNDSPSSHFIKTETLMNNHPEIFFDPTASMNLTGMEATSPYDFEGNIRVIRMYWKSKRKIKLVEFFDESGNKDFTFMPEEYKIDEYKGETEKVIWVNEAWEGTLIGSDIYVNIRPRPIQYSRISNPSQCHFGFIGTIYNINDDRPYSLVDTMKKYNYLYDIVHDRLNKMMARNHGNILSVDMSMIPSEWTVEKWLYYAKVNGIAFQNSFNEGKKGAATGKIAGAFNGNKTQVIPADFSSNINQYTSLLEYIAEEMGNAVGIPRQREAQTGTRETVGGIERAVRQSTHATEQLFAYHNDTRKRALECFLETAKIAMKGRNKKFNFIMDDASMKVMNIDGDDFSECDYGIVVDSTESTLELRQRLDSLAQAALQAQLVDFSTSVKIALSNSNSEKARLIEFSEQQAQQRQQQAQQQEQQAQQQLQQMQMQAQQAQWQHELQIKQLEMNTKIEVAKIQAQAEAQLYAIKYREEEPDHTVELAKLEQQERIEQAKLQYQREKDSLANEYNWAKMSLDKDRFILDKDIKGIEQQNKEYDRKLKEEEIKNKKSIEDKKINAQKEIARYNLNRRTK